MNEEKMKKYLDAYEEGKRRLLLCEPDSTAEKASVVLDKSNGCYMFEIFGQPVVVNYGNGEISSEAHLSIRDKILLFHYLIHADGRPLTSRWTPFHEVTGGHHMAAFKIEALQPLIKKFGNTIDKFPIAAAILGGKPLKMGHGAFEFRVLPMVPVAVVIWEGDEEFPANANILFDSSVTGYLPLGTLDYLGSEMARRLCLG